MADLDKVKGPLTERVVLKKVAHVEGREPNEDWSEAWQVLGTVKATSKTVAIKQLAKDEPGEYRAPSLRAWKGGLEISIPEKPTPETKVFD